MPHDNDLSFFLYIKVLKFVFLCEIMKYTLAQPRAPYKWALTMFMVLGICATSVCHILLSFSAGKVCL